MNIGKFNSLKKLLIHKGINFKKIDDEASEIILYGSRAVGVADENSDWDLLCVGKGKKIQKNDIDITWVRKADLYSAEWLDSELANHVAQFGKWLKGEGKWKQKTKISERTINQKKERIQKYTRALEKRFDKLSKPYVEKYFTKIRRDIQRLFYLERNKAVPPRQIIDKEWRQDQNIKNRVFKYIAKELLSNEETKVLLNYIQNFKTKAT